MPHAGFAGVGHKRVSNATKTNQHSTQFSAIPFVCSTPAKPAYGIE